MYPELFRLSRVRLVISEAPPTIACVGMALAKTSDARRRPARGMNASLFSRAAQSNGRFCRSLGWLLADTGQRRRRWAGETPPLAQRLRRYRLA